MQSEQTAESSHYEFKSENELLQSFRTRDRKHVEVPKKMRFPLSLGHYLTWAEPSGVYRFLVFKKKTWKAPVGVVFKRVHGQEVAKTTCNWCNFYGPSDQITLLTVAVSSKRTVGVHLCIDLSCIEKIETLSNISGKNFEKMTKDLYEKMSVFIERTFELENS